MKFQLVINGMSCYNPHVGYKKISVKGGIVYEEEYERGKYHLTEYGMSFTYDS